MAVRCVLPALLFASVRAAGANMLKPYATRVRATYDFVVATLEYVDRHDAALRKAIAEADAATVARAQDADAKLAVAYEASKESVPFAFKGCAFRQEASPISGDTWVHYDPKTPKTYTIPRDAARRPLPGRPPRRHRPRPRATVVAGSRCGKAKELSFHATTSPVQLHDRAEEKFEHAVGDAIVDLHRVDDVRELDRLRQ